MWVGMVRSLLATPLHERGALAEGAGGRCERSAFPHGMRQLCAIPLGVSASGDHQRAHCEREGGAPVWPLIPPRKPPPARTASAPELESRASLVADCMCIPLGRAMLQSGRACPVSGGVQIRHEAPRVRPALHPQGCAVCIEKKEDVLVDS